MNTPPMRVQFHDEALTPVQAVAVESVIASAERADVCFLSIRPDGAHGLKVRGVQQGQIEKMTIACAIRSSEDGDPA